MRRTLCLIAFILLPGVAGRAAAQQHNELAPPTSAKEAISVTIGGKVGGKKIQGSGTGTCTHAADATMRDVSGSLWTVRYSDGKGGSVKRLDLTLWRPTDGGPDQLSLAVETKSGTHRIETGNPGNQGKGEGSVTILPSGPGGRLEISGKEAGRKPVQITIDCTAFAGVQSEGD
jgi:hypothetical protein